MVLGNPNSKLDKYFIRLVVIFLLAVSTLLAIPIFSANNDISENSEEYGTKEAETKTEIETEAEIVILSITVGDDDERLVRTPVMKVSELLDERNIDYSDDSVAVNYDINSEVFDGMRIVIGTYFTEIYTEDVITPFGKQYIECQTIPKGKIELISEGKDGVSRVTHEAMYINGELVEDIIIGNELMNESVDAVYYVGAGGTVTSKDGTVYEYSYYIDVVATAYKTGGITATGAEAKDGVVAVDPRVIPYGTKMFVTGNYGEIGYCSAEDTGPGIKGKRIDVCMSGTHQDLLNFGRRNMRVYILE